LQIEYRLLDEDNPMDKIDFDKLARLHHTIIYYLLFESYNISQSIAKIYGKDARELYDGLTALKELSKSERVPKEIRSTISVAIKYYPEIMKVYNESYNNENDELGRLIRKLGSCQTKTDIRILYKNLQKQKNLNEDIKAGIKLAIALDKTGRMSIYNKNYLNRNFGLNDLVMNKKNHHGLVVTSVEPDMSGREPHVMRGVVGSYVRLQAEDMAGTAVGAIAGGGAGLLLTALEAGGVGAIPGAIGGGFTGSIMFSGKLAWTWATNWYGGGGGRGGSQMGGGPCHHCPGSPEGPIGQQDPVPPQ
jgi:hypothetical protein